MVVVHSARSSDRPSTIGFPVRTSSDLWRLSVATIASYSAALGSLFWLRSAHEAAFVYVMYAAPPLLLFTIPTKAAFDFNSAGVVCLASKYNCVGTSGLRFLMSSGM